MSIADMTPIDLAGYIGDHLSQRGINVVLSGGACVAYYSKGQYVSMDLDFFNAGFSRRDKITAAMADIGFREDKRYFRHPDTEFLIEFLPGPLGVGDEPVGKIIEIKTRAGTFKIISPTDCVKDRLAGYFHWDDLQCLEQAVLVARENRIDLDEIEKWSAAEGKRDLFQQIRKRLKTKG
ncbi:MAG: hypothetical protein L6455_18665 [Kiritimatiellae bacterium]|nr:hypothetical protein [Kiritimatiellia bacterium]